MLGSGTEIDPYQVETAEDLDAVRNNLNVYYIQMNDIDLSGYSNWIPIGNWDNPFAGSYDGGNLNILNLTINLPNDYSGNGIGLFGTAGMSYPIAIIPNIKNINLINVNIKGTSYVGALIGDSYAKVTNCHSSGIITGESIVGGLIGCQNETNAYQGENHKSDLINCSSSVETTVLPGNFGSIGGLVGMLYNYWTEKCFATGNIISSTVDGGYNNGGFAGDILVTSGTQGYIKDCYAKGNVSGDDYVGGFGGSTVRVLIENCYSVGNVNGVTNIGGFLGYCDTTPISCYYDTEISLQSDIGKGTPKTTLEMKTQSTFLGWDFDTIWQIGDGYPTLRWATSSWPLQTGKDYVLVTPFAGGTMQFDGKEYKFVQYLERFDKEQHLVSGVSRTYEYGGPVVTYAQQPYNFLASGVTDKAKEGGMGNYLPDTARTVLSIADRENFVNFYYILPMLLKVDKPIWTKKVVTWKDVPHATHYEVKLYLDDETQCIDTQVVPAGVQRMDYTYFIETFMPAGTYYCTVQALASEIVNKVITWNDAPGVASYTINLVNSSGNIVYTDSVTLGVQRYDFGAIIPGLPAGTSCYGMAIPVYV